MTDEELESIISNLLRAGVITSAMIVLLAGVVFLIQHHAEPVTYATGKSGFNIRHGGYLPGSYCAIRFKNVRFGMS
jgi:uncharacterized membrane protein